MGHVAGVVGDDIPILAFDDAVCTFSPDHILIGLRSDTHASWQERGLVDEVKRAIPPPGHHHRDRRRPAGSLHRTAPRALLALVAAAAAGVRGGGTASEASESEQLSEAISRYTGLSPGEAAEIASSVGSNSDGALAALAQTVDAAPPLPSGESVATELETIGRDNELDGGAALADLCGAIVDQPSLEPTIQLDPASDALAVRWPEEPAVQLGRAVHSAAVRILERKFDGAGYGAMFLEQFEDTLVTAVASGVPDGSDPNGVLLWLRLEQLRSGACG